MDLKPCPFCGGNAKSVEIFNFIWITGCEKCLCMTANYETKAQAEEAWNNRIDNNEKRDAL